MRFSKTLFAVIIFLCAIVPELSAQSAMEMPKLNQLGFYPEGPKIAITSDLEAGQFLIRNTEDDEVVFEGDLTDGGVNSPSDESVKIADFSDFQEAGRYIVEIDGVASYPFYIGDNVFEGVTDAMLKALYYNRASMELEEPFAGKWARPAGHPDDNVLIHPSAASENRPANSSISSPGGWYDAGDYNKYIVPISVSIYQMLLGYEQFPEFFDEQNINIPESGNDLPDILDEALYSLRWMLTMQDPGDGGVYHKLTTANFSGAEMPHLATETRYVVQKSTAATLDFAAVMAQAARVFEDKRPAFADSALVAAEQAWLWAEANPEVYYNQDALSNPAISTGTYADDTVEDEHFWAATELFITTSEEQYYDRSGWRDENVGNPGWSDVRALGLYSLVHHRKNLAEAALSDTAEMKQKLLNSFSWYVEDGESAPYRSAAGVYDWQFYWGSNGGFGNLAMAFLQLYQISDDDQYYEATVHVMDYLLGRNPLGQSFVTGYGENSPKNIHHRQSQGDEIAEPVPGWLAGGANPNDQYDCEDYSNNPDYPSDLPALSYLDHWCSYSTNEITTYWNSPLIYALGALEAITPKTGKTVGNERQNMVPKGFHLDQNYPNPFNPSTIINYQLAKNSAVKLQVYDTTGRKVVDLVNRKQNAGYHSVRFDAGELSSGVYFYQLKAGDYLSTQKMLLVK